MNITEHRTDVIIQALVEKHCAEYCGKYGEPGYTDPEQGIIFANWNNVSNLVSDYLEEAGYELEWSDEWIVDHNHNKAYRSQPDSYHWEPSYLISDGGELITPDEAPIEWIEECKVSDKAHPIRCLPSFIDADDIEQAGYRLFNEEAYESGFFPGQDDNPTSIAAALLDRHESIIFRKTENSQFYCKFSVFVSVDD